MTGGLIQLISKGVFESVLNNIINENKLEVSYYKTVYYKYLHLATETFEEQFNNIPLFGGISECVLGKYGDLLSDIVIKIKLPALNKNFNNNICVKSIMSCNCNNCDQNKNQIFSWKNGIGHKIIEYVEFQIGSKIIDRQTGDFFDIITDLTLPHEKLNGYNEMIGRTNNFDYSFQDTMSLLIPLNFWFCRNIGNALPVVGLFYEDIILRIKWKLFDECYISTATINKLNIDKFDASLYVDYIFLDTADREKFISESHKYIITQTQHHNYHFSKFVKHPNIDLTKFKYPLKEIIWSISSLNDNKNNFSSAKLLFNNIERSVNIDANYFRLYNPYKYHSNIPENNIYVYSFSLKPENNQLNGLCNFSYYKNVNLQLSDVNMSDDYVVKIYGININVLYINKGLSGIISI